MTLSIGKSAYWVYGEQPAKGLANELLPFISDAKVEAAKAMIESFAGFEFFELMLKFDSAESIRRPLFDFDEYVAVSPSKDEIVLIIFGAD